MDMFVFIKELCQQDEAKDRVSIEIYLAAAKIQKIDYPLTPVKHLIENGRLVLDTSSGQPYLVVST
jgi:hypothetical protein